MTAAIVERSHPLMLRVNQNGQNPDFRFDSQAALQGVQRMSLPSPNALGTEIDGESCQASDGDGKFGYTFGERHGQVGLVDTVYAEGMRRAHAGGA